MESLITGTITPFGDTIRIAVKILDTSTAKIIGASRTNLAKTGALVDLISTGITSAGTSPKAVIPATTTMSQPGAGNLFAEAQAKAKSGTLQKVSKNGMLFELKSCKLNGKTVTFDFIITSMDKDISFALYRERDTEHRKTIMFDNLSNEYTVQKVTLADKSTTKDYAQHLMIKGLPAKSQLIFEKISDNIQFIAMLQIGCYIGNPFHVQFRNIPITK